MENSHKDIYVSNSLCLFIKAERGRAATKPITDRYTVYLGRYRSDFEKARFVLSFGYPVHGTKCNTLESGFFFKSMHFDTMGLFPYSSLNSYQGVIGVDEYTPPHSVLDDLYKHQVLLSKYRQKGEDIQWNGVVLALQLPADKSILSIAPQEDYFRFVEGACKYYGRHLYLKLHPYSKEKEIKRFTEYARAYGSRIGIAQHSILDHCKFAISWNSTFSIDCMLRGVKTAQFARGDWWQQKVTNFTNYTYPDDVPDKRDLGFRFCEFLAWKYCFTYCLEVPTICEIVEHFSHSTDLFPLPEKWSYAANIDCVLQSEK